MQQEQPTETKFYSKDHEHYQLEYLKNILLMTIS